MTPPQDPLRAAAEKAVHLLANYLWNEDGELEDWLIEAHDGLRNALAATEPPKDALDDAIATLRHIADDAEYRLAALRVDRDTTTEDAGT